MSEIKQVIVVRSDLNMRRGKEAAQVAHASIKFLADAVTEWGNDSWANDPMDISEVEWEWLNGSFSKIVVSVDSEHELAAITIKARVAGLHVDLIVDAGRTEFHGEPTKTCIAIGPDEAEKIDKITGHLKLR